jgi:hypothetical protein
MKMNAAYFRLLLNIYPPYWGTGIVVKKISPDYKETTVQMKMKWYNRNYVGTHFGGSLYAMTDPFFMLMLIQILGKEYIVWDKGANIDFVKPGQGTLTAKFTIGDEHINDILNNTLSGNKYFPQFSVDITNEFNETVARVNKLLYVRKKIKNNSI